MNGKRPVFKVIDKHGEIYYDQVQTYAVRQMRKDRCYIPMTKEASDAYIAWAGGSRELR